MKKTSARNRKSKSGSKSKASSRGSASRGKNSSMVSTASSMARRVLFRPDRHDYVKKLIPNQGCVFCTASNNEVSFDTLCAYKSEHSMIVLNKYPYNSGHLLILPRSHKGTLLDLAQNEFEDLNNTLRLAMGAIQDLYKPLAMNVGLNQGRAAGAGIPDHLHYHLIPRWEGDLNFFPLIADTKVVIEALDQTYKKLSQYFQEHG